MAQSGEPAEITAIRTNINGIVAAVTVGNLQWFADSLVQEAFIARTAAQGILGTLGTAPDYQARKLLESVFTKLQIVEKSKRRDWFERFIAIFSDPTYAELVQKLKKGTNGIVVLKLYVQWDCPSSIGVAILRHAHAVCIHTLIHVHCKTARVISVANCSSNSV